MSRGAVGVWLGLVAALPAFAQVQPQRDALRERFYTDTPAVTLLADRAAADEVLAIVSAHDPALGIEVSGLIPVEREVFTDRGRAAVYTILRAFGSMEGIEYYSASRERMKTFYLQSYVVHDPGDLARLPDPVFDTVPQRATAYAFQEDGSFGSNVQLVRYRAMGESVLMHTVNLDRMFYRAVPLIRPNGLRMIIVITFDDARGALRFYGHVAVKVPGLFGMRDRARNSFYHRAVALYEWFKAELEAGDLLR